MTPEPFEDTEDTEDIKKRNELLDRAAKWVVDKGLATPAIFLLEMHKPVAPLGAMLAMGSIPFLGPFFGFGAVEKFALLVEDRNNVEALISRIEKLREAETKAEGVDAGVLAKPDQREARA